MTLPLASAVARHRLGLAARRLGTPDPVPVIGGLLDRSFPLPLGDARYGNNHLTPGHFPLEVSFSEQSGEALRLDLEPLGPGARPADRREECTREVRRLVGQGYGSDALRWYDRRSEAWRGRAVDAEARFGAWFGMALDADGLQEVKSYYELRQGELDALPPNLQHAARVAMALMPELEPIFTSIACGRSRGSQRLYFYHRGPLRLVDLEPLLHRLGIGDRLPNLLRTIGVALGGRFELPEGSVILGLRDTNRGLELKLDVLLQGFPDPPRQMYQLLQMLLAERPRSERAMRRVMNAYTLDGEGGPGQISVVGFKVRADSPTLLSVYVRPRGYTAQGRQATGPGGPAPLPPPRARDPYADLR